MTPEQIKEFNSICREVWDLFRDENRYKDWDVAMKREGDLWERVLNLSKSVGKGLVPGKLVQWSVADGRASYLVKKVGVRSTELAHLPFGDGYGFAGVSQVKGKLVIPSRVARYAAESQDMVTGIVDESDDYYNGLNPGQVVHYSNGFGQFIRCLVTKEKDLLPLALVGEWKSYDLPHRHLNGDIIWGYHAENILKEKVFHPHASNIYEFSKSLQGKLDPRKLDAIDLNAGISPMTPEQQSMADKCKLVEKVQAIVSNIKDVDETLKSLRELLIQIPKD
jgi:hypothetical protein